MIEINGISHIQLTVSNFEKCVPFYEALLGYVGMKEAFKGDNMLYYVGGRTGIAIQRCDDKFKDENFVQTRIGLHHLCLRARTREDVDALHQFLIESNATVVQEPKEGPWVPGYYSLLFEDPDGIRLEINHIPGKRILEDGAEIVPSGDFT